MLSQDKGAEGLDIELLIGSRVLDTWEKHRGVSQSYMYGMYQSTIDQEIYCNSSYIPSSDSSNRYSTYNDYEYIHNKIRIK